MACGRVYHDIDITWLLAACTMILILPGLWPLYHYIDVTWLVAACTAIFAENWTCNIHASSVDRDRFISCRFNSPYYSTVKHKHWEKSSLVSKKLKFTKSNSLCGLIFVINATGKGQFD
jgi:hypothetical protein